MSTSARSAPLTSVALLDERRRFENSSPRGQAVLEPAAPVRTQEKSKLFVAAENRLMREVLARILAKRSEFEIVGLGTGTPDLVEELLAAGAEILLMSSRGALTEDLPLIRSIRVRAPEVGILLLGMRGGDKEFLQCVRAGVRGYLPRDASAEEVLEGVRTIREGGAVCSAELCLLLFRYFEREAAAMPSASVHEQLGFTRREQQIIPLLAQGLTNKEIANQFCLSEQTVKNHLYRMKQKSGAADRLGIVRHCRTNGFLV